MTKYNCTFLSNPKVSFNNCGKIAMTTQATNFYEKKRTKEVNVLIWWMFKYNKNMYSYQYWFLLDLKPNSKGLI